MARRAGRLGWNRSRTKIRGKEGAHRTQPQFGASNDATGRGRARARRTRRWSQQAARQPAADTRRSEAMRTIAMDTATGERPRAIVIGSGFGGLSMGIRLGAMGYDTTILEAMDIAGGRAAVRVQDGFRFDMGPTVITVPHFIEELLALRRGEPELDAPDFPASDDHEF